MKKQRFNTGLALLLALIFIGTSGYAQEAEKEVKKDYSISKGYTLGIENKYGSIDIVNWDKDELSVEVLIKVEAKSQSKADKILESISINISEQSKGVNFETEISENNWGDKTKLEIAYMVKAPAYINVELEQKYGNVFLQEITGAASLEIKYGNLDATSLVREDKEWNELEIGYGNAKIEKVGMFNVELKYGGLTLQESENLVLETKYSNLTLGDMVDLELESKYDKCKATSLAGSASIESAYTNIVLGTIASDFESIEAEMTYGNLEGELAPGASFKIDASAAYGSIKIPGGDYNTTIDNNMHTVKGNVGDNPKSSVVVSLRYGSLKLK